MWICERDVYVHKRYAAYQPLTQMEEQTMILNKPGEEWIDNGTSYSVGRPVCTSCSSEYPGLFGTIEEIRTGADSSSGDEAPDICCTFDLPALSRNVQALERFLTQRRGTPVKAEELPLERIAMKPEMITPLAIPEQDYPKLALYIVDTNWAVDGESGSYEVVFTLHQDALRQFHNDLLEERNSGSIEQWREHSEFAEEETAASYECWLDGCYCENHYKIEVKRREFPLAPGFLRMAANVYRTRRILRDFGQEAARQNEYQALTEAEKKQLLARSDIAEYVMRRLERRVAYWEAYRGAVSDTVRDILRERSAEGPRQCPMNGTEERHDEKSL